MLWPNPNQTLKPYCRKADTTYDRAKDALERGEIEAALTLSHAARDLYERTTNHEGLALAEALIGDVLVELGQFGPACQHYEHALRFGRPQEKAPVWVRLADTRREAGHRADAIAAYEQARLVYKRLGHANLQLYVTHQIALLYYEQEQWAEAEGYYNKVLRLVQRGVGREIRGRILLELGNTLAHLGRLDEARRLFAQSAAYAGAAGDQSSLASALHGLGVTYAYSGQPRDALPLYQHSLGLKTELGDKLTEACTTYELGMSWATLGCSQQAAQLLRRAITLYDELNAPEAEIAHATLSAYLARCPELCGD